MSKKVVTFGEIIMKELELISEALIRGDRDVVRELVEKTIARGLSAEEVLNRSLRPGMEEVGIRFKTGAFFIPEVLLAARAMKTGMEVLRPSLVGKEIEPAGKVVLGTVKGDLHDIGKNLVGIMMEGAGFEVIDLGIDIPPERFIEAVREEKPDILGLSALLTTTMLEMKTSIEALEEVGLQSKVKIMVGGAPVTQSYADQIGADGYAPDAASAVEKARELLASTG